MKRAIQTTLAIGLLGAAGCATTTDLPQVEYQAVESEAEGDTLRYAVYTPPGWDGKAELPLVLFLHGGGDDETALEKYPMAVEAFDDAIASGQVPPFLLVAPDGEFGFWRNWYDGSHNYEDWVMDEVLPDAYARFPIKEGRDNLHVMGVSMGGAGTLYLGLEHKERFGSASVLSAPIFNVEQVMWLLNKKTYLFAPVRKIWGPPDRGNVVAKNPFTTLESQDDLQGLRLFVGAGVGDRKGILDSNEAFHDHLNEHGIAHDYLVYQGEHKWVDWANVYPVALCRALKASECTLEPDPFYALERQDPPASAESLDQAEPAESPTSVATVSRSE